MKEQSSPKTVERLDAQRRHWEETYTDKPMMYGDQPSLPAKRANTSFREHGVRSILELGSGHGRDTLYFASQGFQVTALDYSRPGIEQITRHAALKGVSDSVVALQHDVRDALPFPDGTFDACYSHMLFNMALSTDELEALAREVWRTLRPGGLHVYTARSTNDPHFGVGAHRGENRYETGGYEVHFFDRQLVDRLAAGLDILEVSDFEEGPLPRRLLYVVERKPR